MRTVRSASGKQTLRTCIGCRQRARPSSMRRISLRRCSNGAEELAGLGRSASPGGVFCWPPQLEIGQSETNRPGDFSARTNKPAQRRLGLNRLGRGAYVHAALACVRRLGDRGLLEHAFRLPRGKLPKESIEPLLQEVLQSLTDNAEAAQSTRPAPTGSRSRSESAPQVSPARAGVPRFGIHRSGGPGSAIRRKD